MRNYRSVALAHSWLARCVVQIRHVTVLQIQQREASMMSTVLLSSVE